MMVAKEFSSLGQPVVCVGVPKLRSFFLGIGLHATELVDVERTSEASNANLFVDNGTAIVAFDGYIAQ